MRIALGVEYDGAPFSGWQTQREGVVTVQGNVESALAKVADHPVRVFCAGRTDTGVHGLGQVVHFDSKATRDMRAWVYGTNAHLPDSVAITWAKPVPETFHARFSAIRRRYRYVIYYRPVRSPFMNTRVTWSYRKLVIERMAEAARYLLGEHDFTSYRALGCQAHSPVRSLYRLDVSQEGPFIYLDLEANGFLHHMVRNIAGVLMTIGAGEAEPIWAQQILELKDRSKGGVTAPSSGLYLCEITYPDTYQLPTKSSSAFPW